MLEASKGKIEPSEPFSEQIVEGTKANAARKSRVGVRRGFCSHERSDSKTPGFRGEQPISNVIYCFSCWFM